MRSQLEGLTGWCWGTYNWRHGPRFFLSVGGSERPRPVSTSLEVGFPRHGRVFYVARIPR